MSLPRPREDRPSLGIGIMLICFLVFTIMDTSARWLSFAGIGALQIAFMRYAVHFAGVLLVFLPQEGREILRASNLWVQILRALFLLGSTVLNFFALRYLPLAVTISIFFAMPLMVCLLSVPVLGEKVGARRLSAVAVGFVGVLIIVQPWGAAFQPAMILSLCAMLCASGYFLLTRKVAGRDTNATSQFFTSGVATLCLLPFGIATWAMPQEPMAWVLLFGIGMLGFFGHGILTVAYRFADASVLGSMVYSQLVYATIIGWLVFSDVPTSNTLIGAAIVIGSGLYIWLRERRLNRPAKPAVPQS